MRAVVRWTRMPNGGIVKYHWSAQALPRSMDTCFVSEALAPSPRCVGGLGTSIGSYTSD